MLFQERAMNNTAARNLIIAVAILVLLPCIAYADHVGQYTGGVCGDCHTAHKTLGGMWQNNICLSCHRLGRTDRYADQPQITPFSPLDMAVAEGPSKGTVEPRKTKSSHNWEASDDNPRAGAQPPTNTVLNSGKHTSTQYIYIGNLYCSRCHSVHEIAQRPFLAVSNAQDALCVDCHKPRNVTSHTYGSHPVNVDYATIAAQNPSEYNYPPVNSNPLNASAAMKLSQNKVLCTTCHGVHFADSNSRTFDNWTSAIFNGLSSSQGFLLRTDLNGRNSDDRNICTNCHRTTDENGIANSNPDAKVKNHNGKRQQNIQCADCHGGHVDEADGSTPNLFLVRRYMNVSSASGRTPMVAYTSATSKNWNKNRYGVCVACHPALPPTVSQHASTDANVCMTCHTHKQGFSADCTSCHGFPPKENVVGGPYGYGDGYQNLAGYVDESLSPHMSHAGGTVTTQYSAFVCDQCHKGNNHNSIPTLTFQDVFVDKSGIIAGGTAAYNATTRECTNVYCHSNGAPTGGTLVYQPVTWGNNKGSIIDQTGRCGSCHSATPATNAHTKHLSYNYGCQNCHATTAATNTALVPAARLTGGAHVNAVKEVQFSGTIGSSILSGSNCSAVYCHSNGKGVYSATPVWTDPTSGQCGTCHTTDTIATGAHQPHLATVYGPVLNSAGTPTSCNSCHIYPNEHVDGTVQAPPIANCTSSCHKNGLGTATWLTGRTGVTCESCHSGNLSVIYNITAPDKGMAATTGHGKPAGANKACTECHDNTSAHIGSDPASHTNRLVANLTGSLNTECNYCHNNLARVNNKTQFLNISTHFKVKGGTQEMECWQCHELHGTGNLSMIRSSIAYLNSTSWSISYTNRDNGWVNLDTNRGLCQVCHSHTKYYRAGIAETGHPISNCYNCHPHNAKGGAFAPSGACDACHGYPPVPKSTVRGPYDPALYKGTFGTFNNYTNAQFEDYSGGGGAHLNHVPTYAKATEGWSNCAICHTGGDASNSSYHVTRMPIRNNISNVTIKIDPRVNFNNSLQIIYSGAKLVDPPLVNSTGSCINVGCHFQPTPRWSKDR